MVTANKLHQLAELAEASYTLFDGAPYGDADELSARLKNTIRFKGEFSASQATTFTNNWELVHHQPNTESAFSGPLFQRRAEKPLHRY